MGSAKKFKYHPIISNIIENNYSYILKKQEEKEIISDNLHLLLALHLFKYSLDELYSENAFYNECKINFNLINREIDFLSEKLIIPNREIYKNTVYPYVPDLKDLFPLKSLKPCQCLHQPK